MKIKRALLILTTALVVTGCTPSLEGITEALGGKEEASSEKITVEDEPLVEETTEEATDAESSTDETAEAEGEPVSDEELSTFTNMFIDVNSDCFGFLWPEYSSPEEIKWDQAIGCYTPGLTAEDLTDEEKKEFYGFTDIEGELVDSVVRKKDLTKYIKDHTGLDVTIDAKDVPSWTYNEKYDAFLIGENPWGQDTPLVEGKFVSGTKSGDTYTLKFQPGNEMFDESCKQPERTITFTKSGDKLVFKSNKLGK
ncbi:MULTISPECIES: hypothetical protein [Butyrivibrio]|uniref:Lipoprotein n=1 Tax=Butyrivibrio hungatei TaxID=185008 RepID=A0A1G5GK90_9FIRM|nr:MULTISPECIES: hypothetical protein [Butyrivibrio]SCY51630.1 hypothetical protein SAMN02910451_02905 [Butyrivibrio hungatei]